MFPQGRVDIPRLEAKLSLRNGRLTFLVSSFQLATKPTMSNRVTRDQNGHSGENPNPGHLLLHESTGCARSLRSLRLLSVALLEFIPMKIGAGMTARMENQQSRVEDDLLRNPSPSRRG
jgi:hypothetical protein